MKKSNKFVMVVVGVLLSSVVLFFACQNDNNILQEENNQKSIVISKDYESISGSKSKIMGNIHIQKNNGKNLDVLLLPSAQIYYISGDDSELINFAKTVSDNFSNSKTNEVSSFWIEAEVVRVNDLNRIVKIQLADKKAENSMKSSMLQSDNKAKITTLSTNFSSYSDVVAAFNYVKQFSCGTYGGGWCIPFRYITDGCYARAHKMKQLIESQYGKTTDKIFSIGNLTATSSAYSYCVNWSYHVAPLVYVGSTQYVLDPSMFSSPVSPAIWKNAQLASGCGIYGSSSLYSTLYIKNGNSYAFIGYQSGQPVFNIDPYYTNIAVTVANYSAKTGCSYGILI